VKVGDLIECNGGYRALILDVEKLYPRHPQSPPRNYEVYWLDEPAPYAFGDRHCRVDAFAVEKVLSRGK
jgi:hypothetical protein